MKSFKLPIILAALFINAGEPVKTDAAVWFVRTNGNDALTGTSWTDAKRTVGSALNAASAGDEIWVAQGTYAGHLIFKPDVALYGGFAGLEATRSERNWTNHLSVLWGTTNQAVVTITNAGPATRLDGFTVGGGIGIHGGGIKLIGSGPVIAQCTIRNNITDGAGSGISIWGFQLISSTEAHFPVITNNVIVDNQAINDEGDGAGIAVVGSSPLIAWNVIARNTATRNGGGIACWRHSFPIIANNFIVANSASYDELTVTEGGGGIFASATDLDGRPIAFAISAPVIINNVIAANGGYYGGGITVIDSTLGAASIANNTIVANNGAGIFWSNTWPTNDNNIVAFNAGGFERGPAGTSDAVIRFNNVFGNTVLGAPANYRSTTDRTGVAGNISADPAFANSAIGELHLQPGSPCINAGNTALSPPAWVDIDGQVRVQDGTVDMGADESAGTTWNVPTPVVRVSPAGDDTDGSTWAKAKNTVTGGIAKAASTGGEVWVAQGTYFEHILPTAFVYLYGGFAGGETNRAQRNPSAHPTILDGGGVAPVVYYRNAGYRVSTLDGFIVQGGGSYTGGDVFHPDLSRRTNNILGGGIYCRVSGPMIANNVIRSNSLGSPFNSFKVLGGGFYGYLSHAEITGNTFAHNEVLNTFDGSGGGAYFLQCMANIAGNTFRFNRALNGAALYGNLSELRVARNVVQTNALYSHAAPVYMGSGDGALTFLFAPNLLVEANTIQGNISDYGAGLCLNLPFAARVQNNLILDNLAWDYSGFGSGGWGGGIKCDLGLNATGAVVIAHNTIVGNNAPPTFLGHFGGGIALTPNTNGIILANNIVVSNSSGIWRYPYVTNQPVLLNNCVHDNSGVNYTNLAPGLNDLQADPQFVNRATGDFRLLATSPCIDAGTNLFAAAADFDAVPRPLDGNADGIARCDLGAFELAHAHVDADGDGMSDAAEVVAGTNPTDPASALQLSAGLTSSANRIALRWSSVAGRSYHIEFRPRLDPTETWHTAGSNLTGSGHLLEWQDTTTEAGSRWYRLGVKRD